MEKQDEANEAMRYFFDSDIEIETISDDDKDLLDTPITYEEIAGALKDLANNKSPGSDGLTTNFYKFFWTHVQKPVCDSIIYGVQNGKLSIEQGGLF